MCAYFGIGKKPKSIENQLMRRANLILLKLVTTAGACVESSLSFIRRSHLELDLNT